MFKARSFFSRKRLREMRHSRLSFFFFNLEKSLLGWSKSRGVFKMESRLRPADSDGGARPRYRTPPTPKPPQTIRTPHAAARPRRGVADATRLWRATRTERCARPGRLPSHARMRHACVHACMRAYKKTRPRDASVCLCLSYVYKIHPHSRCFCLSPSGCSLRMLLQLPCPCQPSATICLVNISCACKTLVNVYLIGCVHPIRVKQLMCMLSKTHMPVPCLQNQRWRCHGYQWRRKNTDSGPFPAWTDARRRRVLQGERSACD